MARYLLPNQDKRVAEWVASRMSIFEFGSTPYTAIGLMNQMGVMLAGVVYQNFTKTDIHMHVAALPHQMTREFIGEGFRYPFLQLGCRRVTGLVPASNTNAAKFDERLGFQLEGRIRQILPRGEDLLVYGMLREECRWLNVGWDHGCKSHTTDGYRRSA